MNEIDCNLNINKWGDEEMIEELIQCGNIFNQPTNKPRRKHRNTRSKFKGRVKSILVNRCAAIISHKDGQVYLNFNSKDLKPDQEVLFKESPCTINKFFKEATNVEVVK